MDKDKLQDRIDGYLSGKGSPEARREFEEEISRDEDLSRELDDTKLAVAALELAEDRALKSRLQDLEARLAHEGAPNTEVSGVSTPKPEAKVIGMNRRKGWLRLVAYAAALLLLLAAGWWAIAQPAGFDAQQLAMDSFTPYQNIVTGTVRGDNDSSAEAAAFAEYDAGNYVAAAEQLSALPASAKYDFYLGQSLLAQQKYAEAQAVFSSVMGDPDFPLAQEAAYYNALARLGTGAADEARNALVEISDTDGHPMQDEAKALLTKM
ncbi:hypothetical protein FUA23_10565 [Neolewinella aurantiaca]|uniref:Tetratricopeptide repeat protein n=1 Tax=Neolewinella aurantiaca TaxID=2602767 RepID=A0A5C7FSH2_9BACT|nr:hypothetical protein [Neolewinella aurantiaca]TXF89400.1 hypothetical protein FUA23_10565 [Neolewinella aurantiaca]